MGGGWLGILIGKMSYHKDHRKGEGRWGVSARNENGGSYTEFFVKERVFRGFFC